MKTILRTTIYINKIILKKYHTTMDNLKETRKWTHPLENLKDSKFIFRTGLHVFNSLSNKKEEFITKDGSRNVNWYMCGPTVYDSAHLGHARTYVSFDVIRRIMTSYFGYNVNLCMNITDIDDKIIMRSNEKKEDFTQFARFWEDDFFKDMKSLNILYPQNITRVSEYVPEIIEFIQVLIDKNYAYESNGSVYFDIEQFSKNNVNKLFNLNLIIYIYSILMQS
jgi:cysteinyl-tRNA synthetase